MNSSLELMTIPLPASGFKIEVIDGELLLYRLLDSKVLYLNQTAALIWQLCDGQRSVEEVTSLITEAYPESASVVVTDVQNALKKLVEFGAINTE